MQGRSSIELSPGLRRLEYESHVVSYEPKAKGIRIVRVLHQNMDMKRHLWPGREAMLTDSWAKAASERRSVYSSLPQSIRQGIRATATAFTLRIL